MIRKPDLIGKMLGKHVKRLRTQAGLSQTDLARRLGGITVGMVSHIEAGHRLPSLPVLHALTMVLNCTADELLSGAPGSTYQQHVCPRCKGVGVILVHTPGDRGQEEEEDEDEELEEEGRTVSKESELTCPFCGAKAESHDPRCFFEWAFKQDAPPSPTGTSGPSCTTEEGQ